ncbi:MAG: MFS transporter [Planctomycetia bacterium]|nr:MFS transporter [Planctomycetia bacterium]
MHFAEKFTPRERRNFRILAYASTWFGCFADVVMESSAIIILFIGLLNGSPTLAMFSTSMNGIVSMLLMFPAAALVNRLGARKGVYIACIIAVGSYLFIATAPWWGGHTGKYIVLLGCFLFCVSKPLWTAAWYVILGDILLPEERGPFLGFMRFSYYILTGSALFLIGFFMGKEPSIGFMQTIILCVGLIGIGRIITISKIPLDDHKAQTSNFRKEFSISIRNGSLVSFSIYICMMCLAFAPVLPLTILYLKDHLKCGSDLVQIISTASIAGNICAFFFYGKLQKWMGIRGLLIATHLLYILVPLVIAFFGSNTPSHLYCIAGLTFLGGAAFASFLCIVSQETLALARPGNVAMTTALSQTYYMLGTACGRVGNSILLGSGILSLSFTYGKFTFCHYQSIFLFCAVIAILGLFMLPSLSSMISNREEWYQPK